MGQICVEAAPECGMCSGSISEALFTEKCNKLLQTMFRFSLLEHLGHHCCCIVSLRDVRKESAGYVLSQARAKPSHPATQPKHVHHLVVRFKFC